MELDVEIFAIGQWNGMNFESEDLNMMAAAFNALQEVHKVPLKFGHNEEQPFTDGQPALGWVSKVWVDGVKLMAQFTDIPDVVYRAIENKLYKNVSIELDMGVEHKGNYYTWVLSGVALLGADIPAVNTLADLTSYMSKALPFKKRVVFTATNIKPPKKRFTMNELEKAQAEVARLKAEGEAKDEQLKTFSTEKVKTESELTTLKAQEVQRIADAQVAKFAKARTDMTSKLETMVKEEVITPAQREKFMADYKDEDVTIDKLNFTLDILATGKGNKGMGKEDTSKKSSSDDEDGKLPDEVLNDRIQEYMRTNSSATFSAARKQVMKADLKLAIAYRDMNGEK